MTGLLLALMLATTTTPPLTDPIPGCNAAQAAACQTTCAASATQQGCFVLYESCDVTSSQALCFCTLQCMIPCHGGSSGNPPDGIKHLEFTQAID